MRKTYTIDVCLEDFKTGRHAIEVVFDLIAKVKAAVFSQAGKVFDYSFSNTPDPYKNIDGNIGTLSFDIATRDEDTRELRVEHFVDLRGSPPNNVHVMVSFCRSASTKGFLSNLDPGVGESQAVRG